MEININKTKKDGTLSKLYFAVFASERRLLLLPTKSRFSELS